MIWEWVAVSSPEQLAGDDSGNSAHASARAGDERCGCDANGAHGRLPPS